MGRGPHPIKIGGFLRRVCQIDRTLGAIWFSIALVAIAAPGLCLSAGFSATNIDFLGRGGGTSGLVARVDDVDNVLWNASGLGFGSQPAVFAGFMDYLVGVRGGSAGYVGRPARNWGCGIWFSYLSSGALGRTGFDDPTGGEGGTFKHTELVTGLSGGGLVLPYLSLGGAIKLGRQELDDFSSTGLFGDLSVTFKAYSPDPGHRSRPRVYTSYIARNLSFAIWEEDGQEPPVNSEVALALDFPSRRTAAGLSFYFGRDGRREIRGGLETGLSEEFVFRIGYRRRTGRMSDGASGLPWERGLTAGFSVIFGPVWVDYTYEDASPLDNIHRFGLRTALGTGD
jgi:hypothetical protein